MDQNSASIVGHFVERADKTVHHLSDLLSGIRTGRASPALVDHIRVEAYGSMSQLVHVAHIQVPEPRQLLIKPFDVSLLKAIEKAILVSDLGINPVTDGKAIRLSLPPLSQEQRKKLAGRVKDLAEQSRVALRNERRDANKLGEQAHGSQKLNDDQFEDLKTAIQDKLKEYEKRIDAILEAKTHEIMTD